MLEGHKQRAEAKLAELSKKGERAKQKALWLALYHVESDARHCAWEILVGSARRGIQATASTSTADFSVRFTVFNQVDGPVLSYAIAGPFVAATFSSYGPKFQDTADLIDSLDRVGLPGREIAGLSDRVYTVTGAQLHSLGLKLPDGQ